MTLAVSPEMAPMEAKAVDALPTGAGWQFEPKWDGFRCLAFRDGGEVELRAKSGKPLHRYFPEVVAGLKALPAERFVIDGELAIPIEGRLSFDALQLRLHPAESRIRRLARETPAVLIAFDMLMTPAGEVLTDRPLSERREALDAFITHIGPSASLKLTPFTRDGETAKRWLNRTGGALDGVIAKRLDAPYAPGERAMLKVKCLRTADCVVGGFRYAANSNLAGSLLLGLYNARGLLDHVGFTTIAPAERAGITLKLEALAGGEGFTGNAPGGPSRWSTERSTQWTPLRPELVAEVRYDHVTSGRFRHGTKLLRWRPDKAPRQCTFEQIEPPAPVELFD